MNKMLIFKKNFFFHFSHYINFSFISLLNKIFFFECIYFHYWFLFSLTQILYFAVKQLLYDFLLHDILSLCKENLQLIVSIDKFKLCMILY